MNRLYDFQSALAELQRTPLHGPVLRRVSALNRLTGIGSYLIMRQDLQYRYSWTALPDDDPLISGEPDSTELNRHEGYEVLRFIRRFCENYTFEGVPATKADTLKVERLVREHPGNLRSRRNVAAWIRANW